MNNIPCNDTDLSINEIISTFPYVTVSPHNSIVSDSYNPIITVDINAADAQLKRDFELWLKGIRETTDHEPVFSLSRTNRNGYFLGDSSYCEKN